LNIDFKDYLLDISRILFGELIEAFKNESVFLYVYLEEFENLFFVLAALQGLATSWIT